MAYHNNDKNLLSIENIHNWIEKGPDLKSVNELKENIKYIKDLSNSKIRKYYSEIIKASLLVRSNQNTPETRKEAWETRKEAWGRILRLKFLIAYDIEREGSRNKDKLRLLQDFYDNAINELGEPGNEENSWKEALKNFQSLGEALLAFHREIGRK